MTKAKTSTISELVRALCLDYERRESCVCGDASRRVRMECLFLNTRILSATAEIVGTALAPDFIHEIGCSIGYAKSKLYCMCETTYKKYKAEVVRNIAKKLFLTD